MPEPTAPTERPDSVERFAEDLRQLRLDAGNPTLVALAHTSGISKTVISDAMLGRALPTEKTVDALVPALGGNQREWRARRLALDAPARPAAAPTRRRYSLRALVLVAAAAAVVGIAGSAAVTAAIVGGNTGLAGAAAEGTSAPTPTPTHTMQPIADGSDPMSTVCRDDAVIAASETRALDTQIQMMYSTSCKAVWGRVTRYDGAAAGNSIGMRIYPAVDLDSPRSQEISDFELQSIYTTLMISPETSERVCGVATMTVDGKDIDLGLPLCI